MKCKLAVLAILSGLIPALPLCAQQAGDNWLLSIGNYWVQQADSIDGMENSYTYRKEVEAIDSFDDQTYYRVHEAMWPTGEVPQGEWFTWHGIDSAGSFLAAFGSSVDVDSATFFDPPPRYLGPMVPGSTWQFELSVMGGTFSFLVEDTGATVVVPAGTFTRCAKVRMTISNAGDTSQVGHHYHAGGVGEVLNEGTNDFMDSYRLELQEYFVKIVGIEEQGPNLPDRFTLHQNYPNPFNPISIIRYDLPEAAYVTLVVYDILGREVIRLVDQEVQPGYRRAVWDARDHAGRAMPTGIYIARLVTPEFSKSIKMLLLK
ncbi:MAG: T9SS type A sorting domain-containing protein [Candidatus Marinimicrobia bacterium]|nr:T9SS type A sorting domain-containing protein [Candidatus Neomarinimicrobiota bacterium]